MYLERPTFLLANLKDPIHPRSWVWRQEDVQETLLCFNSLASVAYFIPFLSQTSLFLFTERSMDDSIEQIKTDLPTQQEPTQISLLSDVHSHLILKVFFTNTLPSIPSLTVGRGDTIALQSTGEWYNMNPDLGQRGCIHPCPDVTPTTDETRRYPWNYWASCK